jgi:nucleotide-binding universal stress UspA family protein
MMRYAFDGSVVLPPEVQGELEHAAQTHLEQLLGDDDRRELGAVAVLRTANTPADSIVDYAKAAGIDVTVIGTHGRRAFDHSLLGSVAEHVVRTSPCPVLTVRHSEHECLVHDALVSAGKA